LGDHAAAGPHVTVWGKLRPLAELHRLSGPRARWAEAATSLTEMADRAGFQWYFLGSLSTHEPYGLNPSQWPRKENGFGICGQTCQSKPPLTSSPILCASQTKRASECREYHEMGCDRLWKADEFLDGTGCRGDGEKSTRECPGIGVRGFLGA